MHKFLEYAARCCEELGLLVSVNNNEAVVFHLPFKKLDYADCMILPVANNGLEIMSVLPAIVPEDSVPTLLEYITRLNFGYTYGAFIFNMDMRKLVFQVSNVFPMEAGYEDVEELLRFLIFLGKEAVEGSEDDIVDILEGAEDANALYIKYKLRMANLLKDLENKK